MIRTIINESKKALLEYPLKEAPKIFASRLAILLAIVLLNLVLFGFVLAIIKFSSLFSSTIISIAVSILVIITTVYLFRIHIVNVMRNSFAEFSFHSLSHTINDIIKRWFY